MNGLIDKRLGRSAEQIWLLPVEERARRLMEIYKRKMGYEMDLSNPVTFTEKLQWYKLYYNHPDLSRCVDKVAAKDYIAENLGEGFSAKVLKVWNSPDEVDFSDLPKRFVVKSNCQDSGRYITVVKEKSSVDIQTLADEIRNYWFYPINLLVNGFCNAYHNVVPKVFVEEYLEDDINDYKFFCFGGKVMFCYVSKETFVEGTVGFSACDISFYDLNWNMMDVRYGEYLPCPNVPKPKHLEEMIETSKILSKKFPFVRVDFFDMEDRFYVSELTFYPGGGLHGYEPDEFNRYMGDLFMIDNV